MLKKKTSIKVKHYELNDSDHLVESVGESLSRATLNQLWGRKWGVKN